MVSKQRIIFIGSIAVVLALLCLIPQRKPPVRVQEKIVYPVQMTVTQRQDFQEYLKINGDVRAVNTVGIRADIGGKITKVYVQLGSKVKRGDLLAHVDPSVPGAFYSQSPVYSPISGYVTTVPLTQGTQISETTDIMKVGNIDDIQIYAKIPEASVALVRQGLKGTASFKAIKDETFPCTVTAVSPVVDEISRTKEIQLKLDTTDVRIASGMFPRIKLNTVLTPNSIKIPVDSYRQLNGETFCFVVTQEDGKLIAHKRIIKTGPVVDNWTRVDEGLEENEKVVAAGVQVLSDGDEVRDAAAVVSDSSSAESKDMKNGD